MELKFLHRKLNLVSVGPRGDFRNHHLSERQLSREEVGLQGQILLERFVQDRLLRDEGQTLELHRPGSPAGTLAKYAAVSINNLSSFLFYRAFHTSNRRSWQIFANNRRWIRSGRNPSGVSEKELYYTWPPALLLIWAVFFSLIDRVPPHSPRDTFIKVAKEIFSDGIFNWGRIVALFYFAYRFIKNVRPTADWL